MVGGGEVQWWDGDAVVQRGRSADVAAKEVWGGGGVGEVRVIIGYVILWYIF